MTADDATKAKGAELLRLHQDEKLLTVVNVWDVISAKIVAAVEGTTALATASHSIAASFGYPDGEQIPLDLMLEQVKRIVDVDRPAGDRRPRGRVRRRARDHPARDRHRRRRRQHRGPAEAGRRGGAAGRGDHEGRRGGGRRLRAQRPHRRVRAQPQGRPGREPRQSRSSAARPTSTPAPRWSSCRPSSTRSRSSRSSTPSARSKLTTIGIPGTPPRDWQEEHGVARTSYGPMSLNVALTALQELVEEVHRGGGMPRHHAHPQLSGRCKVAATRSVRRCCHDHTTPTPVDRFLTEIGDRTRHQPRHLDRRRPARRDRARTGGSSATAPRPSRPAVRLVRRCRPPSRPRSGARSPTARPSSST